jgi:GT2 family glycosyltransferase
MSRFGIITLTQSADFPTAWSSLRTLSDQLSEDRRRFVLLNDELDRALITEISDLPFTEVLAPGENLGVAAGRNVLIQRALEWGADFIVTMDDDVFAPSDYLDRLAKRVDERGRDGAPMFGIAAPVLLDYHAIAPSIHGVDETQAVESGEVGSFRTDVTTAELRSVWQSLEPDARRKAVHHMGVRHWRRHYFSALGNQAKSLRAFLKRVVHVPHERDGATPTELRRDRSAIDEAISGRAEPMSIDSAPGGVSVVPAATFRALGLLEEAFAPFGYEDAEMGVRTVRSGMTVELLPSEILLHDLQSRHKEREPLIAAATRAKARAILLRRHGGSPDLVANAVLEAFVLGWSEAAMYKDRQGGAAAGALAYVAGLLAGLFRALTEVPLDQGRDAEPELLVRTGRATTTFSSGETPAPGVIPTTYSGSIPIRFDLNEIPIRGGAANQLTGVAGISYRLDPSGTLHVHHLTVDFPGLAEMVIEAELSGVLSGEAHPDSLLTNTRLHRLRLEMLDRGLIDRLEETYGWETGQPSNGRLLAMSRSWMGPTGAALRAILQPWSPPTRLVVQLTPGQPVSARDLTTLDGGPWHVRRRLGLTIRVTGADHARDRDSLVEGRTS